MNKISGKVDTSYIYYNASFLNNGFDPVPAKISENRTQPILDTPEDYDMSVIRFSIDTSSIPINVPIMQNITGVPSMTDTESRVLIGYQGLYYGDYVVYTEDSLHPLYKFPTIYNYQRWLDLVNTCIAKIYTDNSPSIPGTPPQYIYDPVTQLISIYVDSNYLPAAGANQIKLYLNNVLIEYLYNFEYIVDNLDVSFVDFDHDYQLVITNTNTSVMPAVGSRQNLPISLQTTTPLYKCTQTTNSMAHWLSFRSIILSSTLLPFRSEAIPNKVAQADNYSSNNIFPILSDFIIPSQNNVTDFLCTVEYLPTAEYRRISLNGRTPLTNIDLTFYWTDYAGNKYPIYLPRNTGLSVKIIFEKK